MLSIGRRLLTIQPGTVCFPGEYQLFESAQLQEMHYVLFTIACMHIVVNAVIFTMTNQRFAMWRDYENTAR